MGAERSGFADSKSVLSFSSSSSSLSSSESTSSLYSSSTEGSIDLSAAVSNVAVAVGSGVNNSSREEVVSVGLSSTITGSLDDDSSWIMVCFVLAFPRFQGEGGGSHLKPNARIQIK